MFRAIGRRFAADEAELEQFRLGMKLTACPHCGQCGALIGHGWLTGYAEREQTRIVRGRRFFCSNRFRRPGCGRTFSVLLATLLAGFIVTALTLWRFVEHVVSGLTRKTAWEVVVVGALSHSSAYRLWRRILSAQAFLRARLCRELAPPPCLHHEPLVQLLDHFGVALPGANCGFSSFQTRFQQSLFG